LPSYLVLFSLTSDALARFVDTPSDRRSAESRLAEAAGGKLVSYFWMLGQYDGMMIVDCPDAASMESLSITATSSGAYSKFETHELISAENLVKILEKARSLRPNYKPPGQVAT